jgi:hypothetical protein
VQLWGSRLSVNNVLLLTNPDITVLRVFMDDCDKEKLSGATDLFHSAASPHTISAVSLREKTPTLRMAVNTE